MKKGWPGFLKVVPYLFLGAFMAVLLFAFQCLGQKQGQIQAITGDIRYHLVVNPDSTRTWEKVK